MESTNCGLVLLPGMDGTGELFAPLVSALGSDVPTVVVRYPDAPLDYAGHIEFARASLPRDRPYVVLGESFSGPIAVALAAMAPPGMRGYVLCASFVRSPRFFLKALQPMLGFFPARRVPTTMSTYFLMGSYATESLRYAQAQALRNAPPRALAARLKAIAGVDVREQLKQVRLPGLYLRAIHDRLVPSAASHEFATIAGNARVVALEGPHFLLQTNPGEAARVLTGFLRECTE